ncbi:MAG TPA: hypothetical protein VN408_41045 [Actinoplanes sp.]|nr:hypothetical protein [Actinoplanes sp.]
MDGVLGWVVRWRVPLLVGTLLIFGGFEVGRQIAGYHPGWPVTLVLNLVLPGSLILWSASIARGYHPAVLVARPVVPALEVPPNPVMVLAAVGYTMFGTRLLGGLARDLMVGDGAWGFSVGIVVFWGLFLSAFWASALGRFGVRLYPEGIVSREVLGSVFVPWEALGGPRPAFAYDAQQVTLTVADPARVRKRGLRFGEPARVPAAGVSAELLARTIHEYSNRPELRAAIGTEEELARFRGIPQIAELTAAAPR